MTDSSTKQAQAMQISFRTGEPLAGQLAGRAGRDSVSGTARRDLERYYALLRRELRAVTLSRGEVMLILDISNGTLWDSTSIPLLWAEVADAEPAYGERWGVDMPGLVARLRSLTAGQVWAVVDAVEVCWAAVAGGAADIEAEARRVGLLR